MGWFREIKEKKLDASTEAVAGRIANVLLGVQRGCAVWLNARAEKLGQANVLLLLIILGLVFGLWFCWLIIGVLF